MPTISFNRPVTINPEWGYRNLLNGMLESKGFSEVDAGLADRLMARKMTPEQRKAIREKYKTTRKPKENP